MRWTGVVVEQTHPLIFISSCHSLFSPALPLSRQYQRTSDHTHCQCWAPPTRCTCSFSPLTRTVYSPCRALTVYSPCRALNLVQDTSVSWSSSPRRADSSSLSETHPTHKMGGVRLHHQGRGSHSAAQQVPDVTLCLVLAPRWRVVCG